MATIRKFEDLECWKKARELCRMVFDFIHREPFSRDFALVGQINKSSGSAMDNIAEGFHRGGNREFIQFLSVSTGSAAETRSQLYRAFDRNYISKAEFEKASSMANEVIQMNNSLIKYLRKSDIKGIKWQTGEPEFQYSGH